MMKERRNSPAVNASSMADIAFLLLIFFLVTTTIVVDKGITVKLPPWSNDEIICSMPLARKNVWSVKVNTENQLLVRGEAMQLRNLKEKTKEFILNPLAKNNLSSSPKKALISFQNDRGTTYETYITVYNELKAAYNEIWEEKARAKYSKSYVDLPLKLKREIRKEVPLVISEAEPTDFAQNL